jgi:hypothetical protein
MKLPFLFGLVLLSTALCATSSAGPIPTSADSTRKPHSASRKERLPQADDSLSALDIPYQWSGPSNSPEQVSKYCKISEQAQGTLSARPAVVSAWPKYQSSNFDAN